MSEKRRVDESPPGTQKSEGTSHVAAEALPENMAAVAPPGEPAAPKKLTAEEQMALYEEKLKEEDWGHQPC